MKKLLLVLVTASPLFTAPLFAQELEEITVTAQRREQSLQDVPVAVTAFSAEAIEKQNIKSATDYLALTPNVSYTEDGQFGKRGAGIAVRGVNNLVSGENAAVPSIGVYLDEFSVASVPNQFANPELPDMARIEVLRGPQGTFFGRSAVGGALNLTTQNPTDEWESRVTLGGESYEHAGDQYSVSAMMNAPVSDSFKFRGVVNYEDNSGFVQNVCKRGSTSSGCPIAAENNFTPNGTPDSGHEYFSMRLKGLFDVSDRTSILGTFMYAKEDQGHDENVPSGILDLDTVDTFGGALGGADGVQHAQDPGTGFWPNNQNKLAHDLNEHNDLETYVGILNIKHSLSDTLVLKWISGIIDAQFDRLFDQDLIGGMDALGRTNRYEGTSYSTELRLESSTDRFDWTVGAMYSNDEQKQQNNVHISSSPTATVNGLGVLPPFPTGLGLALNSKKFEAEGVAVFADITVHMNEQWDLVAGGRYSHDKVKDYLQAYGIAPGPNSCSPAVDIYCFFQGFANFPRPAAYGNESYDDFAPRLGFRFQATDEVGLYGMVSKGYKAGGSSLGNNTNADGQPAIDVPFKKEQLWNYELGLKSELMDRRVRFNAAVFYSEWQDMQFEAFRFLTPGDLSSNFEQTINIDHSDALGAELELLAMVTDRLTLSGSLGVLDTEIHDKQQVEITGGYKVVLDGLELPKAPELSYNLAAEYRFPMGDDSAWARLEFVHRDGQYSDIEGLTNLQTRGPSPNQGLSRPVGPNQFPYLSPDFSVYNVRAGWDLERWGLQLYVQNLFEDDYYTGTQENFGISGIRLRPHPRIVGASVYFNF
jgi:iron complex outermembrane receptor protein